MRIPTLNEHLSPRAEARTGGKAQGRGVSEAPSGVVGQLGHHLCFRIGAVFPQRERLALPGSPEVEGLGRGMWAFSGADKLSGRTQGAAELEARNLTPRQRPSRGPGKGRKEGGLGGGQGGLAHTHVSTAPC